MEPMALGSPAGSPSTGSPSNYLPSYLMGESNISVTPRNNTLSPTKGRTLAFATSPTSPTAGGNDLNRSIMQQRSLFNYQQATSPSHNFPAAQINHNHNAGTPRPPTQGLFDSLREEKNSVSVTDGISPAFNQNPSRQINQSINQSIYDSYLNQSDFNASRITSPTHQDSPFGYNNNSAFQPGFNNHMSPLARPVNFWITVYGFPHTSTSVILSHFSQCGTIIDKKFAPQNGNWIHLRFASALECEKALNYHERIIGNNLMIGVTYCKDPSIVDKENVDRNLSLSRVRPLAQISYKTVQSPNEVAATATTPIRSSGIVNKAMDYIFGW